MTEKFFTVENKESDARRHLLNLEKMDKYVFHGSTEKIDGDLEPKQSLDNNEASGAPAISATKYADIAIFRALVNRKNFSDSHMSKFGVSVKEGKILPEFAASKNILLDLKNIKTKGYVYVFNKEDFNKFKNSYWEVRTESPIKPVLVVEIDPKDLPSKINVLKE